MGKLLVLPANVRLDWKVIASANTLAYLASSTVTKEKCFITLTPGRGVQRHFGRQPVCRAVIFQPERSRDRSQRRRVRAARHRQLVDRFQRGQRVRKYLPGFQRVNPIPATEPRLHGCDISKIPRE